jgi:hypothetical protein
MSAITAPPWRNSEAKITSSRVGIMTNLLFFQEEEEEHWVCLLEDEVAAVGGATLHCCSCWLCRSWNLHMYRRS